MTVEHIMKLADKYAVAHDYEQARAALHAAVEELAKDAERYRWLRSLEHCNEAWCLIGSGNANHNLDAAIDAAMKGQS